MLMYFSLIALAVAGPGRKSRAVASLDWCHYWNAVGIEKDECRLLGRETTTIPIPTTPAPPPVCLKKFFFATCRSDSRCASGMMCIDTASSTCCHPPKDMCPTYEQLEIKCIVRNPVNWCKYDSECGIGRKCCPTGCDYNVCV